MRSFPIRTPSPAFILRFVGLPALFAASGMLGTAQTGSFHSGAVNLGTAAVGTATPTRATMTFTFASGGTIATPSVLTRGAEDLDFTDAGTGTCTTNGTGHSYSAGNSCTVVVKFKPRVPGTRYGAVALYNSSNTAIGTAYLYGMGSGPQLIFTPGMQTTAFGGSVYGVAVDGGGNLYVGSQSGSPAVYELDQIPVGCRSVSCIKTVVSGFWAPVTGIAIDGLGNVYVAGTLVGNDAAVMIPLGCTSSSCVVRLGIGSQSYSRYAVAVDRNGNVYVSNKPQATGGAQVQEIPVGCTSSACMITLATGFTEPNGLAADASGNVYVADKPRPHLVEIPAGCVSTVCIVTLGGGFSGLSGVAVDGDGNIYVDQFTTFTGTLSEMSASCTSANCVILVASDLETPGALAVGGSGNLYLADGSGLTEMNRSSGPTLVFPLTEDGATSSPETVTIENIGNEPMTFPIPSTGENPAISAYFTLTSGGDCPLETSGSGSAAMLVVGASCDFAITFAPAGFLGSVTGSLVLQDNSLNASAPGYTTQAVTLDGSVGQILSSAGPVGAVAVNSGKSLKVDLTFTIPVKGKIGAPAVLTQGVKDLDFTDAATGTCTSNGTSHVYDAGDTCTVVVNFTPRFPGARYGAVVLHNSSGIPFATTYIYGTGTAPLLAFFPDFGLEIVNEGFDYLQGLALDGAGNLYGPDLGDVAVKELPLGCTSPACVVTLGGGFKDPVGAAIDGAGNVYVADSTVKKVAKIPPGCVSSGCVLWLGGGFSDPVSVAVDGGGGVYVADYLAEAVYAMGPECESADCVISLGSVGRPNGVAVDKDGTVYVSGDGLMAFNCGHCGTKISDSETAGVALDGSGDVYYYAAEEVDGSSWEFLESPSGCASPSCTLTLGSTFGAVTEASIVFDGKGDMYSAYNGFPEELELTTPPSLTFPEIEDGTSSGKQIVVIQNIGNESLILPVPTSGTNPSISPNFSWNTVNSGVCPAIVSGSTTAETLPRGASCRLPITFTPSGGAAGPISGSLVLTDTTMNAAAPGYAKQSITLNGTATAP